MEIKIKTTALCIFSETHINNYFIIQMEIDIVPEGTILYHQRKFDFPYSDYPYASVNWFSKQPYYGDEFNTYEYIVMKDIPNMAKLFGKYDIWPEDLLEIAGKSGLDTKNAYEWIPQFLTINSLNGIFYETDFNEFILPKHIIDNYLVLIDKIIVNPTKKHQIGGDFSL